MKLDRKQSYGQISGDHHGAMFEQNGRMFDADGEEVIVTAADPEASIDNESPAVAEQKASKPKVAPKTATKGPKKKAVVKVDPPIQSPAPVAKTSAVDEQLAAQ